MKLHNIFFQCRIHSGNRNLSIFAVWAHTCGNMQVDQSWEWFYGIYNSISSSHCWCSDPEMAAPASLGGQLQRSSLITVIPSPGCKSLLSGESPNRCIDSCVWSGLGRGLFWCYQISPLRRPDSLILHTGCHLVLLPLPPSQSPCHLTFVNGLLQLLSSVQKAETFPLVL